MGFPKKKNEVRTFWNANCVREKSHHKRFKLKIHENWILTSREVKKKKKTHVDRWISMKCTIKWRRVKIHTICLWHKRVPTPWTQKNHNTNRQRIYTQNKEMPRSKNNNSHKKPTFGHHHERILFGFPMVLFV